MGGGGTIEMYTKVPALSGLIDKTVKIAKVKSNIFNFPSQMSPILIHRCTKLSWLFYSLFGILSFYASGEQVLNVALTGETIRLYLLKQRSKPRLICQSLDGTTPLGPDNAMTGFTAQ